MSMQLFTRNAARGTARIAAACVLTLLIFSGCASVDSPSARADATPNADDLRFLNRITWGANASTAQRYVRTGRAAFLDEQLKPKPAVLPADAQAQIDKLTIQQRPAAELVQEMDQRRRDADGTKDDEQKKAAQSEYQKELSRLTREAATRHLLRALYSPNQLQEQMTWFWMNHFNVFQYKSNIRVTLGDFEENAVRSNALGRFRDLLGATATHPAMLRYLDNDQNANQRINENYARELMELHTLGVDGGYTQRDVQELARVLTGVGVNDTKNTPKLKSEWTAKYVRRGTFEFNPARHDFGDKVILGRTIKGQGLAELDEALDMLAKHPSTATFVSRKLAQHFVADEPPATLVNRMAATFMKSDGDIAETLRTMFQSSEFNQSLGRKFKDPLHYVVSAVRLAYDNKVILNTAPMFNWINRMGQPLYGRQTPDGYPMIQSAWSSSGQMATRFEIARAVGTGSAGLFKSDAMPATERPAFPQLSNQLYFAGMKDALSEPTRAALDQAVSPQEWNMFLLSSPEFMNR
jgi:uncharacterized protein (DUF1800 family)